MIEHIKFSSSNFKYQREINNDYDFQIALETIGNNVNNNIHNLEQ